MKLGRDGVDIPLFRMSCWIFQGLFLLGGAAVAALILFIDIIVFLCGLLMDWRKKRFQEAIEEAVEEARSEAYKEGYIAGQQDRDSEDN